MSLVSIKKKDYLYKLPVNAGILKKWNKRWFVLHGTTHEGVVRIEYFESEDCEATEIGKRTIPLRECMGLSQGVGTKTHPYVFEFGTQIGHHVFAVSTQIELDEWVESIKEAVREDKMKMKRKKDQTMVESRLNHLSSLQNEQGGEDNKRRSYPGEPPTTGTYRVALEQNETAEQLNLTGYYNLEITSKSISLVGASSTATIARWQYKNIKTYGRAAGKFSLETGRGAETGAGTFVFITSCGREIFGVVHRNVKQLRAAKEKKENTVTVLREPTSTKVSPQKRHSSSTKYKVDVSRRPRPRQSDPNPSTGTYRRSTEIQGSHTYDHLSFDQTPIADDGTSQLYSEVRSTDTPVYPTAAVGSNRKPVVKEASHEYAEVRKSRKRITSAPVAPGLPPRFYDHSDNNGVHTTNPFHKTDGNPTPQTTTMQSYDRASRDSSYLDDFVGSFDNPLAEDLPPLAGGITNPLSNIDDFDINEFDDKLFETLDDMDLHDDIPDIGEDLLVKPPKSLPKALAASRVPPPAPSRRPERKLSQQQFDKIWDDICATIPENTDVS